MKLTVLRPVLILSLSFPLHLLLSSVPLPSRLPGSLPNGMLSAQAQVQPQNTTQNQDAARHSQSPHYAQLVQLREDWARRDPALKGPALLDQQQHFQGRAMALSQAYEQWLQSHPQSVWGWLELAEIHFVFLNRFDTAESYLNQALQLEPESVQANIARAEFDFFFKKDAKAALKRLEDRLQATPQQPELLITLVDLNTRSSNDPNVYADLQNRLGAAREVHPDHQQLQYMQAFLSAQQAVLGENLDTAQAQKALAQYEALSSRYPTTQYVLETAQIARQLKAMDKAQALLAQALKNTLPGSSDHSRLLRTQGDLALEAGAADLDAGRWSEPLQQAQGLYEQLLPQARQLIYPERVQFYYNLGLLAYTQGRSSFNQSASEALVHLNRAVGYYSEATRLFDQLNMINAPLQQDLARAHEMRGMVYQRQNDEYKAREAFQQACDLHLESSCKRLKAE